MARAVLSLGSNLGDRPAVLLSAVYLLYPVAQTAVLFDFHGDTLAAPLLLWAVEAADRRSWRWYALWAGLALSCKVYVAAPVAVLGIILWQRGYHRQGIVTAAVAVAWGSLAFFAIRPYCAPATTDATATPSAYLSYYFLGECVLDTLIVRALMAVIVFGPVLLLVWRAPLWLIPAAAVLIPALLSSGPGPSYHYIYHHYILGVPFRLAAAIYGAAEMRRREGEAGPWRRRIGLVFAVTLLFNILLVDTPLNPRFYVSDDLSRSGLNPARYWRTRRDALKDEWLQAIPDDAAVMADDTLAPHLMNRRLFRVTNMMFGSLPEQLPLMDDVVVDGLYDYSFVLGQHFSGVDMEHDTIATVLKSDAFVLERARDGLLQFGRDGPGLLQEVERRDGAAPPIATFGSSIGLVAFQAESTGPARFLLQFEWVALRPLDQQPPLIAVSQPGDLPQARILHLPTLGLLPTTEWQEGERIVERFEVELPAGAPSGAYPLAVSWYDTGSPYAAYADERSRVGQPAIVGLLVVER